MPLSEFESKLAQIVEDKMRQFYEANITQNEDQNKRYATREEVANALRISLPTLNTLTKQNVINGYRIGRRVLYKWDEIDSVIREVTSGKYKRKILK